MRQLRIHRIQRGLHLFSASHYQSRLHDKISAPIADDHDLLRARQVFGNLILNWFRRNLVPRSEHNQILDSPHDAPIPRSSTSP